ncbi:MAG TPA: hypothetical protein VJ302_11395 [Blastocatellia bacterium]|nr:hypothetical protein [Blastocatellia bacterium]
MAIEDNRSVDGKTTNDLSFEDYVKRQFELIFNRFDLIDSRIQAGEKNLQAEMVERFVQLSRQIQHLDKKVDVFIQEQIYLKDEWRASRESLKLNA